MEKQNNLTVEQTVKTETNKQLVIYHEQKNSPFTIVEKHKEDNYNDVEYFITCHGRVMTYPFKTYKEATLKIKYPSWDLLTAFVFLIAEIQQTKKEDKQ